MSGNCEEMAPGLLELDAEEAELCLAVVAAVSAASAHVSTPQKHYRRHAGYYMCFALFPPKFLSNFSRSLFCSSRRVGGTAHRRHLYRRPQERYRRHPFGRLRAGAGYYMCFALLIRLLDFHTSLRRQG